MHPDDERLAQLLPLLRKRIGMTQAQLAAAAGIPRDDIWHMEAGRAAEVRLSRIRRVMEAVDGRARLLLWWHGAAADRLLDERHAALVERAVRVFRARGWLTTAEVSFSEFGERGSIDIFAAHERERAVAICEVKSVIGSLEETNRILDAKERLAPKIAADRLHWSPRVVGRLLIVPRTSSIRSVIERHHATLAAIYPARSREVRAWLRSPTSPLRGIWFVSNVGDGDMGSR